MAGLPIISAPSNTKLGYRIHGWSIPAGGGTCPGETVVCSRHCYAKGGFFRMPNVNRAHLRNLEVSKTSEFQGWMTATLGLQGVRIMRIHVAGDFYDLPYIEKWIHIVRRSRQTVFFFYTRSWRIDYLLPALIELANFQNVCAWWSMDHETGEAPVIMGIRRAYMAISDSDAAQAPADSDLVFRTKHDTVLKKGNGVLVCPPENGADGILRHTCSSCGVCWDKSRRPLWEPAFARYHNNDPLEHGIEVNAPEVVA